MDITRTQRLLSSGFYPTHFRTRNIWAASAFSQLPAAGPDLFTHTAQLAEVNSAIYGGYSSVSGNTSLSLPSTFTKPSLYPISAYGPSYGWTLRRLYHLNSLTVTGAMLHPVPKQSNSSLTLSSTTPYNKSVTLSRRLASQVTRGPLTRDLSTQLSTTSTLSAPALTDGHINYAQGSLFSLDGAET